MKQPCMSEQRGCLVVTESSPPIVQMWRLRLRQEKRFAWGFMRSRRVLYGSEDEECV